ncbi:MAG: SUMF1/EgtB/PvdO family nonheme iron enzyme [Fulvivirga sp.]
MGGKSEQAEADEFPRHKVSVSALYMDETEVTNAQFNAFLGTQGCIIVAEKELTCRKWVKTFGGSFLCNDSYCSGYGVARRMKSSKDRH